MEIQKQEKVDCYDFFAQVLFFFITLVLQIGTDFTVTYTAFLLLNVLLSTLDLLNISLSLPILIIVIYAYHY